MKHIRMTLTLPEDLVRDLHLYVSKRQISKFIAQLVQEGLETKKNQLAREIRKAAQDAERNAEIEMFDALLDEGLAETNAH
jgi:metal-responsive CopG/Arc/MetJ family transcriptional regulator